MGDRSRLAQQPEIRSAGEDPAGNYFVAAYPPFSAWRNGEVPAVHAALDQPCASPIGLYIHLPFCQKKCDYCYYLSYVPESAGQVDRYLAAVARELELYALRPGVRERPLSFVYFGGGTPSMISPKQFRRLTGGLKQALPWTKAGEVTYECAPRSVREAFLAEMREAGVSRISMGVQSLDDNLLKLNGRVHLGADVRRAVTRLRGGGFEYLNLDLMCGLIGETEEQWRNTVRGIIELDPESVTIYQMEIPHNTRLFEDLERGALTEPPVPWNEKRERLDHGFRELESAGYTVVSAYTAVKHPALHRFHYQEHLWGGGDMLGLGVAAFGYFGGVHMQNKATLESYERAVEGGDLPLKRAFALAPQDRVTREFILQLKLGRVSAPSFRDRHGVDIAEVFEKPLRYCQAEGWLTCDAAGVALTRSGLLRVDRLLPLFYDSPYRNRRYT